MTELSRLGVIATEAEDVVLELTGRDYVETRTPVQFDDWTVDGRPLRELIPHDRGPVPGQRTFMRHEDIYRPFAVASLAALLGEDSPTENAWVRFDDGRVGVLFCESCGDMDCATLSAAIEFDTETVTWRDIAFQVGYEPFTLDGQLPVTITFGRPDYEGLLRALLERWSRTP